MHKNPPASMCLSHNEQTEANPQKLIIFINCEFKITIYNFRSAVDVVVKVLGASCTVTRPQVRFPKRKKNFSSVSHSHHHDFFHDSPHHFC